MYRPKRSSPINWRVYSLNAAGKFAISFAKVQKKLYLCN